MLDLVCPCTSNDASDTNNGADNDLNYRDLVDTTPADGNVYKMLLGALNEWFDDD